MTPARRPTRDTTITMIITLAFVGLVLILVAAGQSVSTDSFTPVWNACRAANYPIGVLAATLVVYRLTSMALDPARWRDTRARHLLAWFAYIAVSLVVAAQGAAYYDASTTPATWLSAVRTALNITAIVLTLWWPHPRRLVHIEERALS